MTWCGCQALRPRSCASSCLSWSLPAGWSATAARWSRCCDRAPRWALPKNVIIDTANAGPDRMPMTLRHLTLIFFAALAAMTPAEAQFWQPFQQKAPTPQKGAPAETPKARPDPAFAAFLQELWPDAQAKGVTR